jgi:hypothetical protein
VLASGPASPGFAENNLDVITSREARDRRCYREAAHLVAAYRSGLADPWRFTWSGSRTGRTNRAGLLLGPAQAGEQRVIARRLDRLRRGQARLHEPLIVPARQAGSGMVGEQDGAGRHPQRQP